MVGSVIRPDSPRETSPPPAAGENRAATTLDSTARPDPPPKDAVPTGTNFRKGTAGIGNSDAYC
ncbi:hypothetical protein [Nocardia anaemiae]|uniref:hypothetical protein n=1 Tax=Nocardia anaemiae TaxID=263910 RepID=UPI0012F5195A|nr:hypothetical protein [Nocardia anaemiae]